MDNTGSFCAGGTAHGRKYLLEARQKIQYFRWTPSRFLTAILETPRYHCHIYVLKFTHDCATPISDVDSVFAPWQCPLQTCCWDSNVTVQTGRQSQNELDPIVCAVRPHPTIKRHHLRPQHSPFVARSSPHRVPQSYCKSELIFF